MTSATPSLEAALFPPVPVPESLTFSEIAREYPIRNNMTYLNSASIAPMADRVRGAVDAFMRDVSENGRNNYPHWCRYAEKTIKGNIARLINCSADELAFVKNTTEGILIVSNGIRWKAGDNVIIADIEYPSNVYCWLNLASKGVEVRWVKSRAGRVLVEDIENLMDARTRLVSLSAVQFSSGFCLDLERTGELCRSRGVLFNLDMIQYLGALELDLSKVHIDFMAAGGHKWLLGPIGTGIFYCRKSALEQIHPHNIGYHSVDKSEDHLDYDLTFRPNATRFEEALVNFPGIWGLNAAIGIFLELGMKNVERHISGLVQTAVEGLQSRGCTILSSRLPGERSGILSFTHPSRSIEEILQLMKQANIHIAVRGTGLRISPTVFNTEEDIQAMLEAMP
jgi:cysteine desulfurase / selenocysteine lyase